MTDNWTTRVLPEYTRPYGVEELHNVWFVPNGYPGRGPVVSLLIPECQMQICLPASDGEPLTIINRPQANKSVKSWIRAACETAIGYGASIIFVCDTATQAEKVANMASKLLPNHERSAIERFYDAAARSRGTLN